MKPAYGKIIKDKMDRLAIIDLMEIEKNKFLVTRVSVPREHRGKGIGTELLNKVIKDADKECATLLIEPQPYADTTMTKKSLINYYKRFGFEYISEEDYMIRKPKCERKK